MYASLQGTLEKDIIVPISMNVKHMRVNLNQDIIAIVMPTVLTLRAVLLVNVETVTQEMGSLVLVKISIT